MLKKKEILPTVAFTFSKKKIEEISGNLQNVDLTSSSEKSQIHIFFQKSISLLKGTDKELPQVLQLADLLKRGIGLHHSGILPLLKEMVEMLFQRGLVKILFATETFAMGVNMPAKTVVFDSIRKHDGLNFRNLLPGEYIQMAGRAGRRGLDTTGTVILLCKGDVPEASELHKMMLGKPTSLESHFRLTYSMILNLLRAEQLRVQDMIKRSFSEFHHQKNTSKHKESLEKLKGKMSTVKDIECYLCSLDLEKYYATCREYHKLQKQLQSVIFSHPAAIKSMSPGRVVMVKRPLGQSVLGVVLSSKIEPVLSSSLYLPEGPCNQIVTDLTSHDIRRITSKVIKIEADDIIRDCSKRELLRFKDELPDRCVTIAAQELVRLTELNPCGLPGLHPINDLKLKDIGLVEDFRALHFMEEEFPNFNCPKCPQFLEHFEEHNKNMLLRDEYKHLMYMLSDESLQLLPEYAQRVEVLKRLECINSDSTVQLKGRVACQMSTHEVMITELLFNNVLSELHPADIAALLSCFVFESKKCSEPKLSDTLLQCKKKIIAIAESIGIVQKEVGMQETVQDYVEQFHFGLMEVVFEWARGMPFSEIIALTDVHEGIIVRTIQRLHELLSDVQNAARIIGDRTLVQKMEETMSLIKRDIVFAASLYTQ
ncbi:Helicase SKI2W [Bulinus truncatus]|nr:Helicase SKI2W [Bulinus truncatus]